MKYENLLKIAHEDGKISKEELEILGKISFLLKKYRLVFDEALEDGVVTEEELEDIQIISTKIYNMANLQARLDGKITKDEEALLKGIKQIAEQKEQELKDYQ